MKTLINKILLIIVVVLSLSHPISFAKKTDLNTNAAGPIVITVNKTDNPCPDRSAGRIRLTVSGGTAPYIYLWNDGATTRDRNNLFRGDYTVLVTDALGETKSETITISDPQTLNILGTGTKNVSCFSGRDGEQYINVTGGTPISVVGGENQYTYTWKKDGIIISNDRDLKNVSSGIYNLRVTDKNGCTADADYVITQPVSLNITETTHTNNINFGESNGAIELDVTGGTKFAPPLEPYSYLWSDGVTTKNRTNLPSGDYSVTVKDANGCEKVFTTTILPVELLVVTGVITENKCFNAPNGSIDITTTGGVPTYQYKWDDLPTFSSNPDRRNLSAGTYKLTVIDANGQGAVRELTFSLNQPSELTATYSHINNTCFNENNGQIAITANGGVPPYSYNLNGNGPVTFQGNNFIIANLSSGNYTILITDVNNCNTTLQTIDILPSSPLIVNNQTTEVNCGNPQSGKIITSVSGGKVPYKFLWNTGATTPDLENISVGDYLLTVTDDLGCTIQKTITVTESNSPIIITETNHVDNTCFEDSNGSIVLNVTGGVAPYTFAWDNGETTSTISNLTSGNYTIVVTDNIGCTKTITYSILPLKEITANAVITNLSCLERSDGSIKLNPDGGTAPYQYFWNFNNTSDFVENLSMGTYRVTITDGNNCTKDFVFEINNPIPITMDTSNLEKPDCGGGKNGILWIKYSGGKLPYTYSLKLNAEENINILPSDEIAPGELLIKNLIAGNYVLTVTDNLGCPKEFVYIVEEKDCNIENRFLYPDPLVSPNDDGLGNDFFKIKNIEQFPQNEVVIYNRWGSEVFRISGYNNLDRVFKGVANSSLTNKNAVLVDGVYYYTIQTVLDNLKKYNKGYIILKR